MASSGRRPPPPNPNPSRSSFTSNPPRTPSNRPSSSSAAMNNLTRSPSHRTPNSTSRPLRGGATRPSPSRSYLGTDDSTEGMDYDNARAEHASTMDELRDRVRRAEIAAEDYQRQLHIMQEQLKDSTQDYGDLEEQLHESQLKVDNMEVEKLGWMREKNQLEKEFEAERIVFMAGQAEAQRRDEDMREKMKRLRDNLARKEQRATMESSQPISRSSSTRSGQSSPSPSFAPQSTDLQRSDSTRSSSKLVLHKDRMIESLRLELAEAQLKLVENENMGGDRMQLLEKQLLEARISNARLMDDNESFQLLLSEKTLNGNFTMPKPESVGDNTDGLGSLAEELESAEGESENYRKLEVEAKTLKEQNKALTLYVENIIGRLLSHKEFENVLEKSPDLMSGKPPLRPSTTQSSASYAALTSNSKHVNADKELPPPPPAKGSEPLVEQQGPATFLQRARSVVGGPKRARPMSINFGSLINANPVPGETIPQAAPPSQEEDENLKKDTTVPLGQSFPTRNNPHRRSRSDMPAANTPPNATTSGPAPTSLVNQLYRGPPSTGNVPTASSMMSPALRSPSVSATGPNRTSFFSPTAAAPTADPVASAAPPSSTSRTVSGTNTNTSQQQVHSSASSTFSGSAGGRDGAGDGASLSGANGSPSRNVSGGGQAYTGAIMSQNRLRPLRLVQEKKDDAEEERRRKKANRGSWMPGWMGGSGGAGA